MTTYELTNLALQAGKGNTEALIALVDHASEDVHNLVRSRVSFAESEDVQQDIWHSLIRYLPRYEGRSCFSTWLYSIVMRRIADHQRAMCRRRAHHQHVAAYLDQNHVQAYLIQTDLVVDDILARCPKIYREVLRLRFCDGMTFAEIEAKTGMGRQAARSRYRRGITWLQSNMDQLGLSS